MIHGRNLIVSIDGTAIAGAKSCSLEISQEFLKVCSPTASRVFDKLPTTYDWSMSVDCLIASSSLPKHLTDLLIKGTKVLLTFTDGSNQMRAGYAYVKSCNQTGSVGSIAKFSASFESSGELYKYTQYAPQLFTEGEEWILEITYNHIDLSRDRDSDIKGVGLSINTVGKLLVNCDSPWGVVNLPFATVKEKLGLGDWQTIEGAEVACGDGNDSDCISLQPGSYTFLCDSDAAIYDIGLAFIYQ